MHQICLRDKSRVDVYKTASLVSRLGVVIVCGPEEREWTPGYYYVLFEDPDGIRLEFNFIPGAGLLKEGENDYVRVDGRDKVSNTQINSIYCVIINRLSLIRYFCT